jgi:glycosidase
MAVRWPRYPLVYEINTRVWLRELSARHRRTVTLATVPPEETAPIAALGFDAVWLMGVWATGAEAVWVARHDGRMQAEYDRALPDGTDADIIGSPYAVSRYEVAEEIGGPGGLQVIRARLGAQGMRVILDFVPNHTARDHRLVREHPDAFVLGTAEDLVRDPASFFRSREGTIVAHGRDPFFPAWTDTAQVNHASGAGRGALLQILLRIAAQCDGLRCDMAMLVLPDVFARTWAGRLGPDPERGSFWKEAIPAVLALHPRFLFLAEAYWGMEDPLHEAGFHFSYDKELYDLLENRDAPGVRRHLRRPASFQDRCARFIENHDEPRAVTAFGPLTRAAAVTTFCAPGLHLFHEGQLEGRRVRVPVQLGRRPAEPEDEELRAFYERLLAVLQQPIFKEGLFQPVDVQQAGPEDHTNAWMVAATWRTARDAGTRTFLAVSNLAETKGYARIPLDPTRFQAGRLYRVLDHVDGRTYERDGAEIVDPGLFIALDPNQAHVFEITDAAE